MANHPAVKPPVSAPKLTLMSTFTNGGENLSFGRMVGGIVTGLVVAVTIFSIIHNTLNSLPIEWESMGNYMKASVPLVLASYGVTKLNEAIGNVFGKK